MSPDEFDQMLHDTEVKLARLRALYEQYFQGIEKMEPQVARKDMDRALELLRKNLPRNTALRFRMQQLAARYGTYITYWQRIGRQIEEGTYKRDLQKVARKRSPAAEANEGPSAWEIDVEIDAVEDGELGSPADHTHAADDGDVDAILGKLPVRSTPAPARQDIDSLAPLPPRTVVGAVPAKRPTGLSAFGAMGPRPMAPAQGASPRPGPMPVAKPALPAAQPAPPPAAKPAALAPPAPAAPKPAAPAPQPAAAARPAPSPSPGAIPARSPSPAAPAPVAPRPAPPATSNGKDPGLQALYEKYAAARQKNNEAAVRFETLKESVDKMMPKLREKYGNKPVDFDVVVTNGRVGLKPKVGG